MLRTTMLRTTKLLTHPTEPGASFGDVCSSASNHVAEPAGATTTIEKQAWRILEGQAADFLKLRGTNG
jgi:hypothetical protein